MATISVQDLTKNFGAFQAVRGASLAVPDGTFFVMLGPSGCGKTTTLRMIAGLELPTSGRILLDGEDVTFRRASQRDIAFVFQLFALYPHMNVRANISYPLVSEGVPRAEIRQRVEDAARTLRITHLLDRSVAGLASGDRQRVALGRAIVRKPKAFLMDEPLGALDSELREAMIGELRTLHDRIGATTVYVTHDQLEAMAMADSIAVMNNGVIEQLGPPQEIYDRPASAFVADFIGSPPMNLLPFSASLSPGQRSIRLCGAEVAVPEITEAVPPGEHLLGARPEHLRIDAAGPLAGEVFGLEYLGTTQIVTVETDAGLVRARASSQVRLAVGERLRLAPDPDRLSIFVAGSGRAVRSVLHHGPGPRTARRHASLGAHG
jgi:multiple sugar transport system ATP-binding protein